MQDLSVLIDSSYQHADEMRLFRPLVTLGKVGFEPGYWREMRQAAMLVHLNFARLEVRTSTLQQFDARLYSIFGPEDLEASKSIDSELAKHPVLSRISKSSLAVLSRMGMPTFGGVAVERSEFAGSQEWILGLPAISEQNTAPFAALKWSCKMLNELDRGVSVSEKAVWLDLDNLVKKVRPLAPAGVNTLRFLRAAHDMEIPWLHVAKNVYQFGWGVHSRWLDSSFTDETSTVSAGLARDKVACAKVLRDAGLPVPKHRLATSAEQAIKVAEAFGFPVVLKPANLDGGVGVLAGLRDADAVSRGFASVIKYGKHVLVEQFIQGQDYRVRVCKDEVIGIVIRKAAAVTGDGINSIKSLIDEVNRQRAKSTEPLDPYVESGSHPISIDEEVQQRLAAQRLNLDSVVPPGQMVRLRGAANISLGGTTMEVTQSTHPDNLELALNAAFALRLDVAGIDLLLPDIGRSWKETGGAICEVNGQPQFSAANAYRKVLERLVSHQGRIPIVCVYGLSSRRNSKEIVIDALMRKGWNIAWREIASDCVEAFLDRRVDALVYAPEADLNKSSALPFDRCDVFVEIEQSSFVFRNVPAILRERWQYSESNDDISDLQSRLISWLASALELKEQNFDFHRQLAPKTGQEDQLIMEEGYEVSHVVSNNFLDG
ncbi:MAG: acetate--CoA ligase family protein [Yoonia sp.]